MGVIDSVVIIIFLIFMIIGFVKGFTKQTLSSFAWLIALVAATSLCKIAAAMLMNTSIAGEVEMKLSNWIILKCGEGAAQMGVSEAGVSEILSSLGLPYFMHPLLTNSIDFNALSDTSISTFLSESITNYLFLGGCYLIIYLLVFLVVKILAKAFGDAVKGSPFSFIDRILGLIWGAVKATFIISILMLLISLILNLPITAVNEWITTDMNLGTEEFGVSKFIFEHNPILMIIEQFKSK